MGEIGYIIGVAVGTLIKFALPVAIIALIVFLIVKSRKGKK